MIEEMGSSQIIIKLTRGIVILDGPVTPGSVMNLA